MNPNEGAAARHQYRRAPIRLMKEPPTERRWRRSLASLAIAALAIGGVSTLAAAPAFAADAGDAVVATDAAAVAPAETPEAEAPAPEPAEEPAVEPAPADEPAVPVEEPAPAEEPAAPAPEPADPAAAPPAEAAEGEAPPAAGDAETSAATSDAVVFLVPPGDEVVDKVEICHATSSYQNPYIINEPAADGDVSGHADHTGPIFWPDIPKHTEWGDIIPPFYYDGGGEFPSFFPGLNWTPEGQAIYENDCVIPTPEPVLTITSVPCILYAPNGELQVSLGPLQSNLDYRLTVFNSEGDVVTVVTLSGVSGTFEDSFESLPPGDYSITLEQSIIEGEWDLLDEQSFTIDACPDLDLMVTPGDCSTGDDGTVTVLFTGLIEGESYSWFIDGEGYSNSDTFIAEGDSSELVLVDLPPGNFVAYIEWDGETPVFDWVGFAIEPCQPGITVEVTECPAAGGTGSAWLTLSNLVAGVEYEVRVTDRGDASGAPYGGVHVVMGDADGNAQLLVSSLPADHEYTAWIDGVFEATWEEPPFVGGGGFTPIGSVELSASADFALQPCPAAPVKPAKVVPAKALPATGANGVGELFLGSMLLLGLGGASLIAARRRRTGEQHQS